MKFELYYPVKPLQINQPFGATGLLDWYKQNGLDLKGHNGVDFSASRGQPVYAAHDGIAYVGVDANEGHGVVLRTNTTFDYQGADVYFKTIYWHLLPGIPITDGQQIKAGDIIGYADSTGLSTGDHLHFGLKPQYQNETNGAWINLDQDNGYYGAIDPSPYWNGYYAVDAQKVVGILGSMISVLTKLVALLKERNSLIK